jgi:YbbR domain-containing protein
MLRRFLRRWFFENAALKLVSLVLAVTLFILVSGEKVTERSVRVGVAYIRPSERVLVSEVPDSVEVWLRGSWTRIKRLDPGDVPAIVIDLTKRSDGDVTIDDSDIRVPAGLTVVSIRPSKLTVQFEHVKQVPVIPELVGAIAEGYVVERVAADPAAIGVRGTQRLLATLADVRTLPVSLAGKRASFQTEVALAPMPVGASS